MNNNKALVIFVGIGLLLYSLLSYFVSKFPLDVFNCSLGVMILIFVFYNEDKKISYLMALFSVNIVQWLILIDIFFNNQVHITTEYFIYIIGALILTLILVNQAYKNHFKSSENGQKVKINMLKDKKKLAWLFVGLIIIVGSLAGFIVYYVPICLYGITLGLMAFIYGYYHENKKINISIHYNQAMISVLILQWLIIVCFYYQIAKEDLVQVITLSLMITALFAVQYHRNLPIKH